MEQLSPMKKMESMGHIWGGESSEEDPLILCMKLHKSQPNS